MVVQSLHEGLSGWVIRDLYQGILPEPIKPGDNCTIVREVLYSLQIKLMVCVHTLTTPTPQGGCDRQNCGAMVTNRSPAYGNSYIEDSY
jgi:hypothetical protein